MLARGESGSQDWELLVEKFGRSPYFGLRPSLEEGLAGPVLAVRPHKRAAMCLVVLAVGGAFLAFAWIIWSEFAHYSGFLFGAVGGLILVAGLFACLLARAIRFDTFARQMSVCYGFRPVEKWAVVPMEGLDVRLSVNDPSVWTRGKGKTFLGLCAAGSEQATFQLVSAEKREKLLPIYEALRRLLSAAGVDDSVEELALADGTTLRFSKVPTSTSSASFRTTKLVLRSPELAVLVSTWRMRAFYALFVAFGLVGLGLGLAGIFGGDLMGVLMGVGIGGVLALGGLLGLTGRLGESRTVFDRGRGLLFRRGAGQARFGGRSGIQLDDVAAFQICSRFVDDSEGAYTSYELNVILRQPPGERITLLSHARQDSVRADAHQLAEFLDRPLVDHM